MSPAIKGQLLELVHPYPGRKIEWQKSYKNRTPDRIRSDKKPYAKSQSQISYTKSYQKILEVFCYLVKYHYNILIELKCL